MNRSAQCWKQNAPQTGVSEGRILLSGKSGNHTVGELGCGPHGRRSDDHALVLHQDSFACNPGGVDAEPPLRQTAGGSTTRVLAPDLIGWRDDGAVMRTAECDPGMSLKGPEGVARTLPDGRACSPRRVSERSNA
jgi:hypothetical protein